MTRQHSPNPQIIVEELRTFLSKQRTLLEAVRMQVKPSNEGVVELMKHIPRIGKLTLGAEAWVFTCHGGGILFEEERSHIKVDVHVRIDEPAVFDAWRIGTYFASMGSRGRKLLNAATGSDSLPIRDAVELVAEQLLTAGLIETDADGLRLVAE